MSPGPRSFEPISFSMRRTISLAPPCSGPYRAATAAATDEYGSGCDEPTARMASVEQFCSWSACRMNSTSRARSSTGFGRYLDRKSTRLNSSHGYISYAVFCLKKKKTTQLCNQPRLHDTHV